MRSLDFTVLLEKRMPSDSICIAYACYSVISTRRPIRSALSYTDTPPFIYCLSRLFQTYTSGEEQRAFCVRLARSGKEEEQGSGQRTFKLINFILEHEFALLEAMHQKLVLIR